VIIHGTAGFTSAQEVAIFFKLTENGENPASTHYIIGLHGEIICCVDERHGAYGNGTVTGIPGIAGDGIHRDSWWSRALNPNYVTISIEHVKLSRDNTDLLTEPQAQASFHLVEHICDRHNIPRRKADAAGGITGHFSMDPVHRSFCPGPYPWDELFAFLARSDNGGT
jgi:N-acetyl-anhydromuramyl-L-alanine amidase AmpD